RESLVIGTNLAHPIPSAIAQTHRHESLKVTTPGARKGASSFTPEPSTTHTCWLGRGCPTEHRHDVHAGANPTVRLALNLPPLRPTGRPMLLAKFRGFRPQPNLHGQRPGLQRLHASMKTQTDGNADALVDVLYGKTLMTGSLVIGAVILLALVLVTAGWYVV